MQIPCVYIPGPAPAVSVANNYYPHHEGARRSPMRIHDVEGKSVVNYPHHECAEFIANRFHEENSRDLPTS